MVDKVLLPMSAVGFALALASGQPMFDGPYAEEPEPTGDNPRQTADPAPADPQA